MRMNQRKATSIEYLVKDIESMLEEKVKHYGERGGFYETNSSGNYQHALGEVRLKLYEFEKAHRKRDLVKAITWLYLIYEQEDQREPRKD